MRAARLSSYVLGSLALLRFDGIIAPMSDTHKLNHYLAAWELSNPQLLTQTITSHIYTVTHGAETFVLKLLSPSETEEQRGALTLRYFDGHGAVRNMHIAIDTRDIDFRNVIGLIDKLDNLARNAKTHSVPAAPRDPGRQPGRSCAAADDAAACRPA
jgi:hypothetical protein